MEKSHTVKLFVGNLPLDTSQEELSAIFESYGQVVSCSVLRQFAFVHLAGQGAAERAIRELNGREFRGRNLVVEESRGRPLHSTKVFVGNLSGMCTTEDLQELFQTFGKVLECDKVKARLSSSTGYAFVHMENKEDALKAIEALHGTSFKGRPLSVELSKVQPNKQAPTGKIPCVSCGKQGHYAGECPAGKASSLEQYQSQAAVLAAAAAAAAGLPLQVQQSVHNSVYNTSTFDPTYAALTGLTAGTGARSEGSALAPAVYGALASQVYGSMANPLYGSVAANQVAAAQLNHALNPAAAAAAQMYGSMSPALAYGQMTSQAALASAAAAAGYGHQVYAPAMANQVFLAAPGMELQTAQQVNQAYTMAPTLYTTTPAGYAALGAADHNALLEAARAHYLAQGQQVLAEQHAAAAAAGAKAERDRSPLRRSAPLLPDPVMKPFMYQRAKRRALLPTPAGREEAAQEEDAMARYYSEYYQQLQQYPQYQYAYPPPGALAMQGLTTMPAAAAAAAAAAAGAVPAAPTAAAMATTLDALRPVPLPPPPPAPPAPVSAPPPPVVASAAAVAMATPHHQLHHHHHHRLYEPPPPSLPPPAPQARKDALLRPLHTPDAPYR
ncbi:RNA-binding protein 14b isoform X1 [Alosa pseudoharengus]|uniref:RNA-binding protein 14b isoform X1 n=1 Tax=Alosa pseudoharengus TaxID=34774 RepID=UPI003F8AD7EC